MVMPSNTDGHQIDNELSAPAMNEMDDMYHGLGEYQYLANHDGDIDASQRIDHGLKEYYRRLGVSGYCIKPEDIKPFLQYMEEEEVNAADLPSNPVSFPLPDYVSLDDQNNNIFIFFILQYCYKLGKPPPDTYIQQTILPKFRGYLDNKTVKEVSNDTVLLHAASADSERLGDMMEIRRCYEAELVPKYPYLNVYFANELITYLRQNIKEIFDDDLALYYYIDRSISLQLNDRQLKVFTIAMKDEYHQMSIINYDLHSESDDVCFYGIMVLQNQCLWILDTFMTAKKINNQYNIKQHELPKSSRNMASFQRQLQQALVPNADLIMNVDWYDVEQFKRRRGKSKITIEYDKETWINECKRSLEREHLPLVPIVVSNTNRHWIEWVQIIHIECNGINVGISFRYNDGTLVSAYNRNAAVPMEIEVMIKKFYGIGWSVSALYMDMNDVYKKHRLTGLSNEEVLKSANVLKVSEIVFSGYLEELEQQIRRQKEDIARLTKQFIGYMNGEEDVESIQQFIEELKDRAMVDDVIGV